MRDVQRIAIVDPSDTTREPLRNLLLGMESVWLDAECSRYEFFFDVIQQSSPDVVIVSLDADQAKALQLIQQMAQQMPDIPVLAVSARGDGQAILQALRSGAREFLTAPVVLEELLTALQRLALTRPRVHNDSPYENYTPTKPESRVVSVVGSRGGVGCTSLAVNLAATMAQAPGHQAALIDLDLALGDADVALDLMADYTLADVALNIDRLDMQFLRRSLSKHSSGLSLLPHPVQVEDVGLIREDHVQRVITLLRTSYTHLVLDLSKGFTPVDVTALKMSDEILLVAQLDLSSLRNAVRMLLTLGAEETLADKVKVVLNCVGRDNDISFKKAEETIGKPVFWQVPYDPKTMHESRTQGIPLLQSAPRSKAQHEIAGLAAALCGKDLRAAEKAKGPWLAKLFSR